MNSRKTVLLFVALLFAFAWIATAEAGNYAKENTSIYLDGKVHIRFDSLRLGWDRDQKFADRIRYRITCLAGKAVLNNVEYLDTAVDDKESVRWTLSKDNMNEDFSAISSHLEKSHIVRLYRDLKIKVQPYNLDTAKVRFHIFASGRDYKVTWEPKTGKMYASW